MQSELKIDGMSCQHCVAAVKTALQSLPGVTRVIADLGKATMTHDREVGQDEVQGLLAEEGFELRTLTTRP